MLTHCGVNVWHWAVIYSLFNTQLPTHYSSKSDIRGDPATKIAVIYTSIIRIKALEPSL